MVFTVDLFNLLLIPVQKAGDRIQAFSNRDRLDLLEQAVDDRLLAQDQRHVIAQQIEGRLEFFGQVLRVNSQVA
ncbi:hypothetical protein D3C75_1104740 [compost metagenome]